MADGSAEEALFSWIHLADLRAGDETGPRRWDQERVLGELRADIARWKDWGWPAPDAILVTGDVAFSGAAAEYATARRWLLEVAGSVGLGPDRVFVVPGSQDVDRSADQDRDTRRLVSSLRAGDDRLDDAFHDLGDRRRLATRLEHYLAFAAEFAPACLAARSVPEDRLHWMHRLEGHHGMRVRLLGLNTGLLSANGDDRGKLWLGQEQIARAIGDPPIELHGELVIALSHEPIEGGWLADEKEAAAWLRNHAHLHLHARPDDAGSEATLTGGGGGLVRVAATSRAYNLAAVVEVEGRPVLRIWPRAWSEKSTHFRVDVHNQPDGKAFAEHPLRLFLRAAPQKPAELRAPLPSSALFEGPGAKPVVDVSHFVGRSMEMDAVRRALAREAEAVCVVVSGTGGMGKTTLAHHFVASEARALFPDGSAWIDATSLPSELGRVAQRFGWKRERMPTTEEAKQWLAHALHDRRVLLVIDNAEADQATELPIPGGQCRTLITSRSIALHDDLGKRVLPLPLGQWSDEVCRSYLREVSGQVDLHDGALYGLAHFVGNLPLAVRLIAKLLRRGIAPEKLLAEMEAEPIDTLDAVARGADRGVAQTFFAAFRVLDETERQVLLAMSACARATHVGVVAKVAGVSEKVAERALFALLEERSLVEYEAKAERPWGLHDVVRMFLREQAGIADLVAAHASYVRAHFEKYQDAEQWREAQKELPELFEAMWQMISLQRTFEALSLVDATQARMIRWGRYDELLQWLTGLEHQLPDDVRRAPLTRGRGVVLRFLGRIQEALAVFESAIAFEEGSLDPDHVAATLGDVAACYRILRRLFVALSFAKRAVAASSKSKNPSTYAINMSILGLCYRELKMYDLALGCLEEALEINRVERNIQGEAIQLGNVAACMVGQERFDLAAGYYSSACELDRKIGLREPLAKHLSGLGVCLFNMGRVEEAVSCLREAVDIFADLRQWSQLKEQLGRLSLCYEAMGEVELALACAAHVGNTQMRSSAHDRAFGFYIRSVELAELRSVSALQWTGGLLDVPGWHVILGENGSGKSTLLRSLALALIGTDDAVAMRQDWGGWIRRGALSGHVEVSLARRRPSLNTDAGLPAQPQIDDEDLLKLRIEIGRVDGRCVIADASHGDRADWDLKGFSVAYGPFRRFADTDVPHDRVFAGQPRLARHITLFDSSVALTESLSWLRELHYKELDNKPEGKLLAPFTALANDPGPPFFLPHGVHLANISSDGVTLKDGNGFEVPIEELSDGYRAVLSLTFDLIRHMANAFGYDHLFDPNDPTVVIPGGVVLIDEIDVHLHPTWQRTIGLWFKRHFPNVQFIVTTHSPLVCQTADSIFVLPAPGSDEPARMLEGVELDRVRHGNVLDAYSTGVFGRGVTRSDESKKRLARLAELDRQELASGLSPEEQQEQLDLRASMPTLNLDASLLGKAS